MPLTSVQYDKVCPICLKHFFSERVNTVYCPGKKCRNKARSYPPTLLESMIAKCSQAMRIREGTPQVIKDYIREHGLIPSSGDTDTIAEIALLPGAPSPGEMQMLQERALNIKRQRDAELLEKQQVEQTELEQLRQRVKDLEASSASPVIYTQIAEGEKVTIKGDGGDEISFTVPSDILNPDFEGDDPFKRPEQIEQTKQTENNK